MKLFSYDITFIRDGFSDFFIIVLLPPILYESAINMEKVILKMLFIFKNNIYYI